MSGLDRTMDLLESPGSAQGHASKYAGQSWPWPALQRAHGRRRPDRLRPRLQAWPRRHRLEAQGFGLPFGALPRLAQDEESGLLGGEAGSGGGLGSGTLAIAGRPVRNIHRAQGVCSDGNPPQSLVRVLPRPRPTSLLNATHSGGVLVVDEPTQPGAAIRGRLEHSRLRRRYFSAALILHTKGR